MEKYDILEAEKKGLWGPLFAAFPDRLSAGEKTGSHEESETRMGNRRRRPSGLREPCPAPEDSRG